ncbi:hypothetical protein [Vreelandella sulfidaeris]|uniref:Polymer-forming cytoskeletal protein n=1 Tax=Vreelandella sulfidaeris TaxID=115553 RepID=A0A455UF25_9GAMM|nr:hypothetical protein HSBAA_30400 [Halomonas sulfidaeris]
MKIFQMHSGKGKSRIIIDGRDFVGSSVSIDARGKVVVDGVSQSDTLIGDIQITVNGDVERLDTASGDVEVTGNVGQVTTVSGDVEVSENVLGNVKTVSGDVDCNAIGGSVSTVSGDVSGR